MNTHHIVILLCLVLKKPPLVCCDFTEQVTAVVLKNLSTSGNFLKGLLDIALSHKTPSEKVNPFELRPKQSPLIIETTAHVNIVDVESSSMYIDFTVLLEWSVKSSLCSHLSSGQSKSVEAWTPNIPAPNIDLIDSESDSLVVKKHEDASCVISSYQRLKGIKKFVGPSYDYPADIIKLNLTVASVIKLMTCQKLSPPDVDDITYRWKRFSGPERMIALEFDFTFKNLTLVDHSSKLMIYISLSRHLLDKMFTTMLPGTLLTCVFFVTMWMAPDTINDRINLTATLLLISIKVLHDSSLSLGEVRYMTTMDYRVFPSVLFLFAVSLQGGASYFCYRKRLDQMQSHLDQLQLDESLHSQSRMSQRLEYISSVASSRASTVSEVMNKSSGICIGSPVGGARRKFSSRMIRNERRERWRKATRKVQAVERIKLKKTKSLDKLDLEEKKIAHKWTWNDLSQAFGRDIVRKRFGPPPSDDHGSTFGGWKAASSILLSIDASPDSPEYLAVAIDTLSRRVIITLFIFLTAVLWTAL